MPVDWDREPSQVVWLNVLPSTVNGTDMGDQELRYALFLRYGIDPPYLTPNCYGCNAKIFICHALDCKKGGLITTHHNELRNGFTNLAGKYFTPSYVCGKPLTH